MIEEKDIGALWIKEGKSGKFMSGKVKVGEIELSIVVFRNTHKEDGSKQPDYRIYKQRERGDASSEPQRESRRPVDTSDIPF